MKNTKVNKKILFVLAFVIILIIIVIGLIKIKTISINNKFEVAPLPKEYLQWLELSEEEKHNIIRPRSFEISLNENPVLQSAVENSVKSSYPASYDLRDYNGIKGVKNQRNWGYCWAYAGTSSLESHLLIASRKDINEVCKDTDFDLNPMHVGYALSYYFKNNIDNMYGKKELGDGGNAMDNIMYWTSGLGPVSTEKFQVTSESKKVELPATDILVETENIQVDNVLSFPTINILEATEEERTNYINLIKQTILDNGAVAFASAAPESTWYNSQNYAVYSEKYEEYAFAAHEMLIVGWDDNFPKENFNKGSLTNEYPIIDGAWIVQNSWGEDYGDNGYCYYSYMDYNLNNRDIISVAKTSEIDYDNIYQYNPIGNYYSNINKISGNYAANVFSKSKNNEILTEVSFYNFEPNVQYEIYVNPVDEYLTGENVKYVQTYTDTNAFAEYINIELDEPIELTGEKFAIILKITNPNGGLSIPYLIKMNSNVENEYVGIKEGQSFVSNDGKKYTDIFKEGAILIKGFTKNSSNDTNVTLNSSLNTNEIRLKGEEEGILITTKTQNITEEEKLTYTIYNSEEQDVSEKFIIAKSSNRNMYYANIGIPCDYNLIGNYKIKIQYEDVEEVLDFTISRELIKEINFARSEILLQKNGTSNLQHKISILPTIIVNPELKYRSLDENVVKVSEDGVATAISEGNTKVEIYTEDGGNASKQVNIIVVNLQEEMAGGDGTEENPYLIETPKQLNLVKADLTASYKLNNNIDLRKETSEGGEFYNNGEGWEPIGYAEYDRYYDGGLYIFYRRIDELRSAYKREGFQGIFDGNNYTIKGLNINTQKDFVSLFGLVENAKIKNIRMENGNIEGRGYVGGVIGGAISSDIENVYNINEITGGFMLGGIVGEADSCNISRIYNLGKIHGKTYKEDNKNYVPERVGGIVGNFLLGNLNIAYNNADLEMEKACRTGGICGRNTGKVENVYNSGNITESKVYGKSIGGIVGWTNGRQEAIIKNSYNIGNIYSESKDESIGNVVGYHENGNLTIDNVYVLQNERKSIGEIYMGNIIDNSYKKSDEELKQQGTYQGFDFENIWKIDNGEYPTFIGQENKIQSLIVKEKPSKLNYLFNVEKLDITGIEVIALYENGKKENIEIKPEMVSGFDNTKLGEQEITITYEGTTTTFTVTVEEGTLEFINQPTKLIYLQNKEKLDLTGCKVALKWSDGTVVEEIEVTEDMVSSFDNTKLGEQEITITYEGVTITFTVTVEEGTLEVINQPTKLIYLQNKEELDLTGCKVALKLSDETVVEEIEVSEEMVTGFDNTKLGEQEIIITYEGVTTTFTVTVEKGRLEILNLNHMNLTYLQYEEELDLTLFEFVIKLSDGRVVEEVEVTEEMVTGFDNTRLGEQEITVAYKDYIMTFIVTIEEGTIWDISATEEDEVYAKLSSSNTLIITGKGKTANFDLYGTPWKNKRITYIEVKEGIENLGEYIFSHTRAYEIYISSSVIEISYTSLRGNENLENIIVSEENKKYCSVDGILYNKEVTELIHYPEAKNETVYYVPDTIKKMSEMSIEYNKNLEKIVLGLNVKNIGAYAMKDCSKLKKVVLTQGVEILDYEVFMDSSNVVLYTNNDIVIDYAEKNSYSYIIDKDAPTISKINKENNTITIIGATDGEGVGLAQKPYSFDDGITWQEENYKEFDTIPENDAILVKDELYNVYKVETEEKAKTPEAIIDYEDNKLRGLQLGSKYRVSGEGVATTEFSATETEQKIADDWYGKTISLVQVKTNDIYNSDAQIIEIPALREAPTNIYTNSVSNSEAIDGKILGWTTNEEFSKDKITWIKCTDESTKNLKLGEYYIRYSYIEGSQFASKITEVYIYYKTLHFNKSKEYTIPSGNINTNISDINLKTLAEIDGGALPYTYTKISGPDWINISDKGIITGARPSKEMEETTAVIEVKDKDDVKINITINIGKVENILIKGDVNGDGKLTLYDAFTILRKVIIKENITEEEIYIMDYNDDGKVTLYDAFSFLRMIILA